MKDKVRTVMKEFKSGDLKSSSGKKVTNPKQAIAIALSEAGKSKSNQKGGYMPVKPVTKSKMRSMESDKEKRKAVSGMKKGGMPMAMKNGKKVPAFAVKKMAMGGYADGGSPLPPPPDEVELPKGMFKKKKKMASGGMPMKKMAGGGKTSSKPDYSSERTVRLQDAEKRGREYGREIGRERQSGADRLGGVIGTPAAYISRAGQYVGDKFTDADAFLSEKLGMQERAATRRGERMGLKDEGYKKGGMAMKKMASGGLAGRHKSADGIAKKGKTDTKKVAMKKGGMTKMKKGGYC